METLTTGEVADRAGVNVQTLRYYERRGILPEPPRRPSGYRQYDAGHVTRVRFIKRAQQLGFTLEEIDELLALRADPGESKAEVKRRTLTKIAEVEAKIRDLQQIKRTLDDLAEACSGHGSTSDCPILHALDGEEETACP